MEKHWWQHLKEKSSHRSCSHFYQSYIRFITAAFNYILILEKSFPFWTIKFFLRKYTVILNALGTCGTWYSKATYTVFICPVVYTHTYTTNTPTNTNWLYWLVLSVWKGTVDTVKRWFQSLVWPSYFVAFIAFILLQYFHISTS